MINNKGERMKKLVEVENSGFEEYIGEVITLFCCRYIYTGKLTGVSVTTLELTDAAIVYETGSFDKKDWSDAQKLPHSIWNVERSSIESWGKLK
jgi:hypothetical protein